MLIDFFLDFQIIEKRKNNGFDWVFFFKLTLTSCEVLDRKLFVFLYENGPFLVIMSQSLIDIIWTLADNIWTNCEIWYSVNSGMWLLI